MIQWKSRKTNLPVPVKPAVARDIASRYARTAWFRAIRDPYVAEKNRVNTLKQYLARVWTES